MSRYAYPIVLEPDDNGTFLVTVPDVPEVTTDAETLEEAPVRAREALLHMLDRYMRDGRPIPVAADPAGRAVAEPSPLVVAKLSLYQAMRDQEVSQSELARRLGLDPKQVQRLLDLHHRSWIDEIDRAMRAVGLALDITAKAA